MLRIAARPTDAYRVYLAVVVVAPYFTKLIADPRLRAFVDGVTAADTGPILSAVILLGQRALIDVATVVVCLATHPAWRRLYVASESGVLSAFVVDGATLHAVGEIKAPHAHTVSVDPRTHRVDLPLENVDGHPLLRILTP